MKTFTVSEPFLDVKCGLSEGPLWERDINVLRFVDINNNDVYRVNLDVGPSSLRKHKYESSMSVTAELEGSAESFLYGGKYGVGVAQKESSDARLVKPYWTKEEEIEGKDERMRSNDGAVDSQGRFWTSAMCDPQVTDIASQAILFRMDLDGQLNRVLTGLTIPNGMSWSKDDSLMYFTDTGDQSIYTYDFDVSSGAVSNKKSFFKPKEGGPDGHAQDVEGNLWVAVWGAWKVVRLNPQGEVTAEVKVPTRCPTAVAFAGEDIYITSEEEQEPDKYPESERYAGCVFKCSVGVEGKPINVAKVKV